MLARFLHTITIADIVLRETNHLWAIQIQIPVLSLAWLPPSFRVSSWNWIGRLGYQLTQSMGKRHFHPIATEDGNHLRLIEGLLTPLYSGTTCVPSSMLHSMSRTLNFWRGCWPVKQAIPVLKVVSFGFIHSSSIFKRGRYTFLCFCIADLINQQCRHGLVDNPQNERFDSNLSFSKCGFSFMVKITQFIWNETKRNETKQNKTKQNKTKRRVSVVSTSKKAPRDAVCTVRSIDRQGRTHALLAFLEKMNVIMIGYFWRDDSPRSVAFRACHGARFVPLHALKSIQVDNSTAARSTQFKTQRFDLWTLAFGQFCGFSRYVVQRSIIRNIPVGR